MLTRSLVTLVFTLSLVSGCVVAGEEDAALEELEASCAPEPDRIGDLRIVSLSRDGREISIKSLTDRERQLLDVTIRATDEVASGDGKCEFSPNGWYCVTDFGECGCEHTPEGPDCYCQVGC